MRTIKYRAWLEMKKRMFSWEELINLEIHQFSEYPMSLAHLGEEPFIWLQFTGLLDKNGKEIYEGDIIANKLELDEAAEVKFFEGAFWAGTKTYRDKLLRLYIHDDWKVIGNIYENPELLNKKV